MGVGPRLVQLILDEVGRSGSLLCVGTNSWIRPPSHKALLPFLERAVADCAPAMLAPCELSSAGHCGATGGGGILWPLFGRSGHGEVVCTRSSMLPIANRGFL